MAETSNEPDAPKRERAEAAQRPEINVTPGHVPPPIAPTPAGARVLAKSTVASALAVAVVADAVQLLAGPLGWLGFDQVVDVIAMAITWRLLGFHVLLLPTFVLEAVPLTDEMPTWTACVLAVILLRRRKPL